VNGQTNPDERFDQVESTLNQLANSQRHLLTAQVLMNDRLERAETAIQKLAEGTLQLARSVQVIADKLDIVADKLDTLTESLKHTDSNVEALTEIARQLIERNGNGGSGRHPS
jgi:methyl-accepting chemotaxis protein